MRIRLRIENSHGLYIYPLVPTKRSGVRFPLIPQLRSTVGASLDIHGLIRFSGHIEVNEDNAQGVLLASTFLQCFRAERVAADFILANLIPANSFSIFLLAVNCGSTYLADATESFILKRIQTFHPRVTMVMEDLLHADVEKLKKEILEEISDNYVAFIVICGWVLYDLADRHDDLSPLLKSFVIIELIPPDALLVDGLEDHPGLIEALQESTDYDVLPLRGKIKFWDTKNLSIMSRVRISLQTLNLR